MLADLGRHEYESYEWKVVPQYSTCFLSTKLFWQVPFNANVFWVDQNDWRNVVTRPDTCPDFRTVVLDPWISASGRMVLEAWTVKDAVKSLNVNMCCNSLFGRNIQAWILDNKSVAAIWYGTSLPWNFAYSKHDHFCKGAIPIPWIHPKSRGEESVESWSLFKVNKGAACAWFISLMIEMY